MRFKGHTDNAKKKDYSFHKLPDMTNGRHLKSVFMVKNVLTKITRNKSIITKLMCQ